MKGIFQPSHPNLCDKACAIHHYLKWFGVRVWKCSESSQEIQGFQDDTASGNKVLSK